MCFDEEKPSIVANGASHAPVSSSPSGTAEGGESPSRSTGAGIPTAPVAELSNDMVYMPGKMATKVTMVA